MLKRGFTLIELLVVISIIGILMGIILPNLDIARDSARDARRISDIKNLQFSLALYHSDYLAFPLTLSSLESGGYVTSLPKDPVNGDYYYSAYRANSTNCVGGNASLISFYHLGAGMEVTDGGWKDDDEDYDSPVPYTNPCTGSGGKFHGMAALCVGVSGAGYDNCYDVVPY